MGVVLACEGCCCAFREVFEVIAFPAQAPEDFAGMAVDVDDASCEAAGDEIVTCGIFVDGVDVIEVPRSAFVAVLLVVYVKVRFVPIDMFRCTPLKDCFARLEIDLLEQ